MGFPAETEVRFVILARRPGQAWAAMWSVPAQDVTQEYAEQTWAGFSEHQSMLEYRLVRRTVVTSDEVLQPKGDPDAAV